MTIPRRFYNNVSTAGTLSAAVGTSETSFSVASFTSLPTVPFTCVVDRDQAAEEVVLVTAVSGSILTVTRGYDGTAGSAHGSGAAIEHAVVAEGPNRWDAHSEATSDVHGVTGSLVDAGSAQTLTNKTINTSTFSSTNTTSPAGDAGFKAVVDSIARPGFLADTTGQSTAKGVSVQQSGVDRFLVRGDGTVAVTPSGAPAIAVDVTGKLNATTEVSSAKLTSTGGVAAGGAITGATTITASGLVTAADVDTGTMDATGNATVGGTLGVTGATTLAGVTTGAITTTGAVTADSVTSTGLITGNTPLFVGLQNAEQTLANATSTPIALAQELIDTHGGHSTVTNNSRYTAQVAGWYLVSGAVNFKANASNRRAALLFKNGLELPGGGSIVPPPNVHTRVPTPTLPVFLAVGDYVDLRGFQDSGGNLNTEMVSGAAQSMLSVSWLRKAP
jgi:hypothetical protein